MRIGIFSIFDAKGQAFLTPFFMSQVGQAMRAFSDAANDPQAENIYKHPEDFTLFHLGSFDVVTGKFELKAAPEPLGVALQFKRVNFVPEVSSDVHKSSANGLAIQE